ncbi:centrosomal protein of 19 kDa isoform X2 [Paroedura picta]|uniref:centrosomal protein of 19 kDa isoform X2 n=1 Tax=Paroedura picta TaxID=143630 RepID=UPI004055B151
MFDQFAKYRNVSTAKGFGRFCLFVPCFAFVIVDCSRAAEQLKNNPRHKTYLEGVSMEQLQKLHSLLRFHLGGQRLTQSLKEIQLKEVIDPEENLNKLDDQELAKKKKIMDELFEKNRKKKDDPDFVYNVEVDFPQGEEQESCGWDADSDDEF